VSQVPAECESSTTIPSQVAGLRRDLELPKARDPETRILTIFPMRSSDSVVCRALLFLLKRPVATRTLFCEKD
jgi:hypothetical protein